MAKDLASRTSQTSAGDLKRTESGSKGGRRKSSIESRKRDGSKGLDLKGSANPISSSSPTKTEAVTGSAEILSKKVPMINPDQFNLAVETLLKHSSQTLKKKVEDGGLFADDTGTNDCMIHLIISLKRVLSREKHKPIRIDLDHSLIDPRQSGVCLIVKDPQREYKDLMEERKIKFISKVVGITKLKGKHSSFEAKRLLLSSHAMFLADKRLLSILPGILGSKFFQSKKLPVPVDLTEPSKVKERLEKAISSTYLRLGAGSCLAIKVADMSRHSESQIKENLVRVLEQLGKKLPMGGWANIQGVHVKTGTSVSLPIWLADLNEGEFGRFNLTPTTAEQDGRKRAEEKRKDQKELFEKKKQQRNQKRKRSSSEPAKPSEPASENQDIKDQLEKKVKISSQLNDQPIPNKPGSDKKEKSKSSVSDSISKAEKLKKPSESIVSEPSGKKRKTGPESSSPNDNKKEETEDLTKADKKKKSKTDGKKDETGGSKQSNEQTPAEELVNKKGKTSSSSGRVDKKEGQRFVEVDEEEKERKKQKKKKSKSK